MKSARFLALFAVAAVAAGSTFALAVQEKGKEAKPASAKADDPFMAKWMEFATPGAEHKMLDTKVGKWTDKVTCWMSPDAPPMAGTSTSEYKWTMGGRYLQGTTKGDFDGMPFEGMATIGYDNMKKKYVSSWIDNMGTGIMTAEGTYDAATKTCTYMGESPEVMSGKYLPSKSTEKMTDKDTFVGEMWSTDAKTGKMFKSMEITSTRAK
jgi:hypothetical protein